MEPSLIPESKKLYDLKSGRHKKQALSCEDNPANGMLPVMRTDAKKLMQIRLPLEALPLNRNKKQALMRWKLLRGTVINLTFSDPGYIF